MAFRKKQELLNERLALQARINRIDEELIRLPDEPESDIQPLTRPVLISSSGDSLRDLIIAIISEVGYMITNTSVRYIYQARFDKALAASQLNELSDLERRRKEPPGETLYDLGHPLQLKGKGVAHISNIWVRADWPIYQRIYLPVTMRLINLHFLDWYITNHGSRHHDYLSRPAISTYVGELIHGLEFDVKINHGYDSVCAKKIVIREIEKARQEEVTTHSTLAFKIISRHQRVKKNYGTSTEAITLLK